MSPPGVKEKDPPLDFNAQVALGPLSPQGAWSIAQDKVEQALEDQREQAQSLADKLDLRLALDSLPLWMSQLDPVAGINNLHYINHSKEHNLNLRELQKVPPLEVLEAVIRILTVSDRWASRMPT